MLKGLWMIAALCLGMAATGIAQTKVNGRSSVVLNGKAAKLVVDVAGGSIADFHLQDHGLNPLQWDSWSFGATPDAAPPPDPRSMGHFLCLDRWGPASQAEIANGMGWHGEATQVVWEVLADAKKKNGMIHAQMKATLPLAGLSVKRTLKMHADQAIFTVREEVTNHNKLGRIYNIVQHPTIGPPFLDQTTVVDANARKGFMQHGTMPNPEEPSVYWPQALTRDGESVNIRYLTTSADPAVVSYIIEEDYGWTTASNAGQGLLIGYLWKTDEYGWFDAWRHVRDGKPFARGLEFGTTGLHQPTPVLVEKGRIFGRKIFEYIDASETQSFSYANFLFTIPNDFNGVARLTYQDGKLTLFERQAGPERALTMEVGKLFD